MNLLPPARTAAVLITAGLLLGTATPAWAHVHVQADRAVAPGAADVRMTFHVPNEKASARTVGVRIEVPEGVRGVRAEPVAGWVVEPAAVGDADRTVGWSGGAIGGENEAEFVVHIDRLPTGVPELAFVARQEYHDGEVVTWGQETVEGQPEPEHPAPVLSLTGASAARPRRMPGPARTTRGRRPSSAARCCSWRPRGFRWHVPRYDAAAPHRAEAAVGAPPTSLVRRRCGPPD
ncbi:YcnI family protein [Streptomyces sp. LN245]|uniref:YcnI family copper-binding membrane protein n=1 Tax=Streptomyces sp. LN245 TaxID=3112975 RepID=UPI003710380B